MEYALCEEEITFPSTFLMVIHDFNKLISFEFSCGEKGYLKESRPCKNLFQAAIRYAHFFYDVGKILMVISCLYASFVFFSSIICVACPLCRTITNTLVSESYLESLKYCPSQGC